MAQYVATKFRKHPLSFMKGGCIIIVTMINGESFIYDKIKYPKAYIDEMLRVSSRKIINVYVDNDLTWSAKDQEPKPRRLLPLLKRAA